MLPPFGLLAPDPDGAPDDVDEQTEADGDRQEEAEYRRQAEVEQRRAVGDRTQIPDRKHIDRDDAVECERRAERESVNPEEPDDGGDPTRAQPAPLLVRIENGDEPLDDEQHQPGHGRHAGQLDPEGVQAAGKLAVVPLFGDGGAEDDWHVDGAIQNVGHGQADDADVDWATLQSGALRYHRYQEAVADESDDDEEREEGRARGHVSEARFHQDGAVRLRRGAGEGRGHGVGRLVLNGGAFVVVVRGVRSSAVGADDVDNGDDDGGAGGAAYYRLGLYITLDASKTLAHALITSRLDYGNALMYGLPMTGLQKVHNSSARSQYKILMYTFNALQGTAPQSVEKLVVPYQSTSSLRSESGAFLAVPTTRGMTYASALITPGPYGRNISRKHDHEPDSNQQPVAWSFAYYELFIL
ncbi:hypothetical protein LSH36_274g06057 [Paralvinella palmiformis]|uniref:Uncharacterized protein n=1 Tax=Paralvinella palmiformis TaxID=53620 RepID=A0AAD9JKP7_9ANNE|nr:hypothetical protein LSH36_274g06057 [Paralvinella palmiformis]